jgi:hypothetical protein
MDSMPLVEKEIARGVLNFLAYLKSDRGLDISAVVPNIKDFMQRQHKARRISLVPDTYMHVCTFLQPGDIVCMTTTCHEFMEHYPNIWGIIQNYYFPKSLIPATDYIAVRHAISLDYYFIVSNRMWNSSLCDINDDEKVMVRLTADISSLSINSINYRVTLITHHGELRARKQTRSTFFDESDENTQDFLDCFRFNSLPDENGNQYYTIKPEIDCRMYGLDPVKDLVKTEIKRRWVTGEYTEESDYDFDSDDDEDPEFLYEYACGCRYQSTRYRIRPDYC